MSDKTGVELIAIERKRQIDEEHWSPEHDDDHDYNELARAAACYAIGNDENWPWDEECWKPSPDNRIRELEKAGALIAAEIDRLLRAEPAEPLIMRSGDKKLLIEIRGNDILIKSAD